MKKSFIQTVCILLSLCTSSVAGEFMAGADFSHVVWLESLGKQYKRDGEREDPIAILKSNGVNYVRLRQFTSTDQQGRRNPYGSINNLDYNLPLAKRVKAAGLSLLLDFHYSDTWADPAHQRKPRAWEGLEFDELKTKLYEYNRDCMAAYKAAGVLPDMVQTGNEITPGMLWPDGRNDSPQQWDKFAALLKECIRGIRDGVGEGPMPRIMLHIDRGGDWEVSQWFFDNITQRGVEFDIIGQSYYPFWHGSLDDLQNCLVRCARKYGKPVVIVETSFPWCEKKADGEDEPPLVGIRPGKDGQVAFLAALKQVLEQVPDNHGIGIFWWAAEFVPVEGVNMASFPRQSFFDFDGNALPVIHALGKLAR